MMKASTLIVALAYPLSLNCKVTGFGLAKLNRFKAFDARTANRAFAPIRNVKVGCSALNTHQFRPFSTVNTPKDEVVKTVLTTWVRKWVIGQGLCPWAAGVMSESKLDVVVVRLPYEDEFLEDIYEANLEAAVNVMGTVTPTETSLVALPAITDFSTFLDLVTDIEEILEENELTSEIQLATFHPDYQFADTDVADVTNYTNRSPFPVIQLLRVPQVTEAIGRVNGNTDFVWKNNIKRMKLLGLKEVQRLQAEVVAQATVQGGDSDQGTLVNVNEGVAMKEPVASKSL